MTINSDTYFVNVFNCLSTLHCLDWRVVVRLPADNVKDHCDLIGQTVIGTTSSTLSWTEPSGLNVDTSDTYMNTTWLNHIWSHINKRSKVHLRR